MRKIIMFNMVTLDGYFEGPNREIDWHHVDEEFFEFAQDQLDSADGLLFGRITYELMASYWPNATESDPIMASKMNAMPKVVFSRTLEKVEWINTRLVNEDLVQEVSRLKQQPGRDLLIFGSADLASTLTKLGLIDEYRIMVNPVVLGNGHPLFKGVDGKLALRLVRMRTFKNGNVLLYYQPVSTQPEAG
jgi:dihydrofolate reductase